MKSGLLILNIVLAAAVAVLFYLHFSSAMPATKGTAPARGAATPQKEGGVSLAYFDMDSVEASYALVQDVKTELNSEQRRINNEKERLARAFREKYARYQNQEMNQVQSDAATRDLQETQKRMDETMMSLEQRYQDMQLQRMTEIKNKIETFLSKYNGDRRYAYIFANEPGLFYYRDSAFNITRDLLKGLNAEYSSTKKK